MALLTGNLQCLPSNRAECREIKSQVSAHMISCFQEIRAKPPRAKKFLMSYSQPRFLTWHAPFLLHPTRAGVITIINLRDHTYTPQNEHLDENGRFIILLGKLDNKLSLIINLYGDCTHADGAARLVFIRCLTRLKTMLGNLDPEQIPCIWLAGDLNCILVDRDTTFTGRKPQTERALLKLITFLDLFDTIALLRRNYNRKEQHTYFVHASNNSSRLDRIYVKPNQLIGGTRASFPLFSDHNFVSFTMQPQHKPPRQFRFKLSLLTDTSFRASLNSSLRDTIIHNSDQIRNGVSPALLLDIPLRDLQLFLTHHITSYSHLFPMLINSLATLADKEEKARYQARKQRADQALADMQSAITTYQHTPSLNNKLLSDEARTKYMEHLSHLLDTQKAKYDHRAITKDE